MNAIIRPMSSEDKVPVMKILRRTVEFKPFEVDVAEELINAYLDKGEKSGYPTLVAVEKSNVVGYVCYGPTPLTNGTWDVYWIAVLPEMKGKGIGTELMKATEHNIAQNNGRIILIETSSTPEYELTRRFYTHIGYSIVCRIPDFYSPGDDKVVFQKRLV